MDHHTCRSRASRAAAVAVVVAVVSACGSGSEPEQAPVPDGQHRVSGTAVAKDDTGLPDTPMTDTSFVLLPTTDEPLVWEAAGLGEADRDDQQHLPYLSALLEADVLDRAVLVEAGRRGRFTVDAPAGEYLFCRVGDLLEDGSRSAAGCDRVTITGPASWRVSGGEGGLHVTVE